MTRGLAHGLSSLAASPPSSTEGSRDASAILWGCTLDDKCVFFFFCIRTVARQAAEGCQGMLVQRMYMRSPSFDTADE